jgi:hypothetical protein
MATKQTSPTYAQLAAQMAALVRLTPVVLASQNLWGSNLLHLGASQSSALTKDNAAPEAWMLMTPWAQEFSWFCYQCLPSLLPKNFDNKEAFYLELAKFTAAYTGPATAFREQLLKASLAALGHKGYSLCYTSRSNIPHTKYRIHRVL